MSIREDNESLAVSVTEAARLLGVGRTLAYRCVRTGELPSVTLGGPYPDPSLCIGAHRQPGRIRR